MRRTAVFGAVLVFATATGARIAHAADGERDEAAAAESAAQESSDSAGDSAAAPAASNANNPNNARKKRGKKKGRRPLVSGRVVPDDQLRTTPLGRPSGELHVFSVNNAKDEADVNIYNDDGSYDI